MRTFDFTPLYRSTVGFDRMFDMLDSSIRPDWPPYDIEKLGEDKYRISMAVAGFSTEEIELTQEGTTLVVSGSREVSEAQQQGYLHRGLVNRNFKQTFSLADHVKVTGASLHNGLLQIDLALEVPEQLKPRRIAIGEAPRTGVGSTQPQKRLEQDNKAAA
jgi:molecular chaperone IbpA